MKTIKYLLILLIFVLPIQLRAQADGNLVSTFSIVARDSATGELGVAVASKFFGVGTVVPWATADVGAIATQALANTSYGWRGLELLESGLTPEEVATVLIRTDETAARRQFGIVSADGASYTFTGDECMDWAGGRNGQNYAVQGNILTGEDVVIAMEKAFLETEGMLADRLYAALLAGEAHGGDSRGKQSAAMLVVQDSAGYGGFTDKAIDIRVDDHPEPFEELGRILRIAQIHYSWRQAWTLLKAGKPKQALRYQEKAAELAPDNAGVLYDLACIRVSVGKIDTALNALEKSLTLNPDYKEYAQKDPDLAPLKGNERFEEMVK